MVWTIIMVISLKTKNVNRLKPLGICMAIVLIEAVLFWLTGILTISYAGTDTFRFNSMIRNQLIFLIAAFFIDILLFTLVFRYSSSSRRKGPNPNRKY